MTIFTASGAVIAIGSSATPAIKGRDDATILADFEADSYIDVGEIESLGEFGDTSEEVTFTSLADARVRKLKGPRNAGNVTLTVGDDPTDEGQLAFVSAEASPLDFNFRVTLNDAITEGGEPSVQYFFGKVMSKQKNVGNASNVVRRNFTVGINSPIYELPPS